MAFYLFLFLLFSLGSFTDIIKIPLAIKKVIFVSLAILLIFLSGIRWNTGADWGSYYAYFQDIEFYTSGDINLMEPGFTALNVLFSNAGASYVVFTIVMAFITIGIKTKVIYEHKEIMMIALFLYFSYYLGDICFIRQFTSISILLYSTRFIIDKKFVPFLIVVLLASSIHIASVFFLLAYWIYHIKYNQALLYALLVISLILGLSNVASLLINVAVKLMGASGVLAEKLLRYNDQAAESGTANPYLSFLLGVAKRAIILPLFISGANSIKQQFVTRYKGYLNLLVFGNVIYFLFSLSIPAVARLSVPFLIFEIFIWGYWIISLNNKTLKILSYGLLVLFAALRLYQFIAPYKELYIPFETIFNDNYTDRTF